MVTVPTGSLRAPVATVACSCGAARYSARTQLAGRLRYPLFRKFLRNQRLKCLLYMKAIFNISILTFLFMATSSPCFAMMSIAHVSKERAKELGMEIRAKANGPNVVWVELEFKPVGQLKDFSHVSLEIRDEKKFLLGYTALREKRTSSGSVVVTFMANRAYLEKITLSVVVGEPMNMAGYELRVKDFIEPEKVR